METVIMWIMAAGALIGGADRLLGNRLGLGEKFEEAFLLLGSTALSMAGIICLVPLVSWLLKLGAVPFCNALGLDPAMLGGWLAIDMGGYQLARELAVDTRMGDYGGIVVAATFGCTLTFTVPMGMGILGEEERPSFAKGILLGLGVLPVALLIGGALCGLPVLKTLVQSIPVFLLSLALMAGLQKFPGKTISGFSLFAEGIKALTTIGLIAGAVAYMTGWKLLPMLAPIEEAMSIVASIGVVMLGSLPVAELLQRLLRRPMNWLGIRTGMNSSSIAGLLISIVSVVPAIVLMKNMNPKGRVVNGAFMVCSASMLAAHMGFVFGVNQEMVVPLLVTKVAGGVCGAAAALFFVREKD